MALTAIACVSLICGYRPNHMMAFEVQFHNHEHDPAALAEIASHHLIFPPPPSPHPPPPDVPNMPFPPLWGGEPSPPYVPLAGIGETDDKFPLWVFLALGLVIQMNYFFQNLIGPDQEVGVSFITMFKMLEGDVAKFMKVFVIVTINYGFAAYICYPKVGDIIQPIVSPSFNSLSAAMQDMVEVSLLGDTVTLNIGAVYWDSLTTGQTLEAAVFVGFLWYYIIMSTILLLNLLIAMMGDTFLTVKEQAVREWRVANLQLVLRLEVLAKPFTDVRSGTEMGGQYFVLTRSHDVIEEADDVGAPPAPPARFKSEDEAMRHIQKYYRLNVKPAMARRKARREAERRGEGMAKALPKASMLPAPAAPPAEEPSAWADGGGEGTPRSARMHSEPPVASPFAPGGTPRETPREGAPTSSAVSGSGSAMAPSGAPARSAFMPPAASSAAPSSSGGASSDVVGAPATSPAAAPPTRGPQSARSPGGKAAPLGSARGAKGGAPATARGQSRARA